VLIDDTPLGWRLVIPNASRSLRHGRSFQASLPGWGARIRRRTSAGRGHEGYSCAPSRADCHPRTVSKALPFCHVTLRGQKPLPPGYPTHPKTLGDHLRKQRLDLGISQRELGGRLGVSKASVEHWERNQVKPSRTLAIELLAFLGLPVPPPVTSLARRLMAFRRSRRLTHGQVARLLGVHMRTVIRWETGRTTPAKTVLGRVEALLARAYAGPCPAGLE